MKYCSRPYKFLYLDTFDGNVYLCSWTHQQKSIIGNILEEDLMTIWNGPVAQKVRECHTDNTFSLCRIEACPHLQNNDFIEIEDPEEYKRLTTPAERPLHINLAYDFVCNQYCETCRPSVWIPPKNYEEKIKRIQDAIAPYLETAEYINASGHGDPFASPYMFKMLSEMRPKNPNLKISLETNGVFFDEEHWAKIEHFKDINLEVLVTINSFDKWTYEHISRGGNYEKLMHNLKFISELRDKNYLKHATNIMVVQDRNFREIPSFIERTFRDYSFDKIILRPVFQWGTMPEKVYWFKDVLNPKHPYHAEYLEILKHPALQDKRVYNFGGEMDHPARDFYIEGCCCNEKIKLPKKLSSIEQFTLKILLALTPSKKLRKKIRDRYMFETIK